MNLGNLGISHFEIDVISRQDLDAGNYTDENVLIHTNPEIPYYTTIFNKSMDYVASAVPNIYGSNLSFLESFVQKGAVVDVETYTVRHKMKGTGKTMCISQEPLMLDNPAPGIGHSYVTIKLNKRLFQVPDTVYPEKYPEMRFTVQESPVGDGTGYIYTLQLHTRDGSEYVSHDVLKQGLIWKKDSASVSEGSYQYGSTYSHGTTTLIYESSLTNFSKQHEVTDEGLAYAVRLKAMNGDMQNMQVPEKYIGMPEAIMIQQFNYEKQNTLFWGRSAGKNVMDTSTGLYRRIGEGAIEFYEDGNIRPYNRNNFTTGFLKEIFRRFFYGKVTPNRAKIEVQCGLGLMQLVDDALTREYNTLPVDRRYEDYIRSGATYAGSSTAGKHLTTPTFLGFDLKPYGQVSFSHLSVLDDIEANGGRMDEKTGMPEYSFWGFVNDIGIGTGNNLNLLRKKGAEFYEYTCGVLSPLGLIDRRKGKNTQFHSAHGGRTYVVQMGDAAGVKMKDTKRSMFILPADRF